MQEPVAPAHAREALLKAIESSCVHQVKEVLSTRLCGGLLDPLGPEDLSALELAVDAALAAEKIGDGELASRACDIVQALVDAGANLFGSRAVARVVQRVANYYVPAALGQAACFRAGLECDVDQLMAVGGSMDPKYYAMPPLSIVHRVLQMGSVKLAKIVCTSEYRRLTAIVLHLFKCDDACEGQWATLAAFVAWQRPGHDAVKVGILEFLVDKECGMDPLEHECALPGLPCTEYPLLHGLVTCESGTGAFADAGFAAFVDRLVQRVPGLLTTYDRANQTAYVLAASLGHVRALRALESAVESRAASRAASRADSMADSRADSMAESRAAKLPASEAAPVNLPNPTAACVDFQERCDVHLTTEGVCVYWGTFSFCPVQALVAAATNGHMDAVSHLLARHKLARQEKALEGFSPEAVGSLTEDECTHDGIPFTVLLLHHASEQLLGSSALDAYCRSLQVVLEQCRALGEVALVDDWGNSVLHVAAHLQVPLVARSVAAVMASDLAMIDRANRKGVKAHEIARRKEHAARALVDAENARVDRCAVLLAAAEEKHRNAKAVLVEIEKACSH